MIAISILITLQTLLSNSDYSKACTHDEMNTNNTFHFLMNDEPENSTTYGLGMVSFDYTTHPTIYFYTYNIKSESYLDLQPYDSIVFNNIPYNESEIISAPPYLMPAHMKMDYGLLLFKIISITKNFIEIEVNASLEQTAWVSREVCNIMLWPEFMLNVYSVEIMDTIQNPLRVVPFSHGSQLMYHAYSILQPVQIKGDWMQVILYDGNLNKLDEGWIRWRENNKLLVNYSLLC
ncbi:MAG: hypothetical protein IPG60_11080 [Bacteroidetes bacterium]|nr:hypothetical protein [Bacteroidota bacterium]MBK7109507.1 hypothetical protein [Bacteroidota bacterium]MBK8682489.1 hypothetical protein [Bacteroidota bacterium]